MLKQTLNATPKVGEGRQDGNKGMAQKKIEAKVWMLRYRSRKRGQEIRKGGINIYSDTFRTLRKLFVIKILIF